MHQLAAIFKQSDSVRDYLGNYCGRLAEVLGQLDPTAVENAAGAIEKASEAGRAIFCIANGGSAGAASHLVNDLVAGSYMEEHPPFRAFCLADNVETVTALANDACYEDIFLHQLRVHLSPGDVVLAMSVSGNSENIVRAVAYARERGATVVAFCGFDGGRLAKEADIPVLAPTTADEYGPAEDAFVVLGHIISTYLSMKRGKQLQH